jgi:putative ABC transport system substrate-binding protein
MQKITSRFTFWGIVLCVLMTGILMMVSRITAQKDTAIRLSILQVVEHPALDQTRKGILDELTANGLIPGKTMILSYESAQGNPSLSGQIAAKYVGENPDILVGISTPSAQSLLAASRNTPTPIIFSSVTDPLGAKLVDSLDAPTSPVTGVSNLIDLEPQIELIKEIVGNIDAIGVIYNPGEANSQTLVQKLKDMAPKLGVRIVEATASKPVDVADAARRLVGNVGAIFITNDSVALSAFEIISKVCVEAKCPLFCSDVDQVGQGAVASFGPNQYELGRQTGRLILKRLQERNTILPVEFPKTLELHVDKDAAKRVNLILSATVLKKAQKIYDQGAS